MLSVPYCDLTEQSLAFVGTSLFPGQGLKKVFRDERFIDFTRLHFTWHALKFRANSESMDFSVF